MGLPRTLDAELCDVLIGWHALDQTLPDHDIIVDFNLPVWQTPRRYTKRTDVLNDLNAVLADPGAKKDRMFFQRVYGLRAYMMDVLNGRTTPIDEYLPATMGFKLVPFPKADIDDLRKQTFESLAKVGVDFDDALNGLASLSGTVAAEDIPAWFSRQFKQAVEKTNALFPTPPALPEPDVSLFEDESMTRARINGTGRQFSVQFNRKAVKEETEENLLGTLNHEILGHAVQAALWVDQIESGAWPVNRGLTCMQGVEQFQMEALAEYARVYYSDSSDLNTALLIMHFYTRMVTNNVNHMILKEGEPESAVIQYHRAHIPWRDEDFARRRVLDLISDSTSRCYTPVYGPGLRFMMNAMDTMDQSRRRDFMRAMYEGYMDPTDLYELSLKMGAKPLSHFHPVRPPEVQAVAEKAAPSF